MRRVTHMDSRWMWRAGWRRLRSLVLAVTAFASVGASIPGDVSARWSAELMPVYSMVEVSTDAVVPGRVLVRFKSADLARQHALLDQFRVTSLGYHQRMRAHVLRSEVGGEWELARLLASHPDVEYAEPDRVVAELGAPNDPYYQGYQWNLPRIGADEAWITTVGSSRVTIAVLDSGVDLGHPDLAGKIVTGFDFVNGDSDPSDDRGHGTMVASVAAATTNNGQGMASLAWQAKIMPVKVLAADGYGSMSWVAEGIIWATDHGADVINLSLAGGQSTALQEAVDYAHGAGVTVVAAAGNSYLQGSPTAYPAACDNVIAVAAVDEGDSHASYSNSGSYIDLAAPGGDPNPGGDGDPRHWIVGAAWRGAGYEYAWGVGTSFASPHVAGVAALILSVDDSLSPDHVKSLLTSTAVDVESPGWDELSGYGRVDAAGAVAATEAGALVGEAPDYSVRAESLPAGIEVRWTTSDERDTTGFRVLRSVAGDDPEPLQQDPIAALSSGVQAGSEYMFLDFMVKSGTTYSYWLEVWHSGGEVESSALTEAIVARWWVHIPLATAGAG